jgi:hypothetical protein
MSGLRARKKPNGWGTVRPVAWVWVAVVRVRMSQRMKNDLAAAASP